MAYELYDLLVKEGKEPIFIPGMKTTVAQTLGEENSKKILNRIGIKDKPNNVELNDNVYYEFLKNLSTNDKDKKEFEKITGIYFKDFKDMLYTILKIRKGNNPTNISVSSYFDKDDHFGIKK